MPEIHAIKPIANASEHALRVAAYCRVSSDSTDQLNSFAAQVDYYTKVIDANKSWQLTDIYADEARTGIRADTRPEFQRLLRDCRKGKIDKVLTKSISRFSRNMKDCLTSIRELKMLGVEIFFEKEQMDTGSFTSEMLLGFYGTLAQEESVSISNNMRWSYQRRMQSGDFITCCAPYGYRLSGSNLLIDDDEAPVVRRIFAEFLAGKSAKNIAADLVAESVPTRHGYWTEISVKTLLRNEKYAGNALLQKRYTTDTLPFKKVRNHGERDMYYIEQSHPPIINPEDFERVKELKRLRTTCQNQPARQHLFSRKIVCGACGHSFKRKVCRGKVYWVCWAHCADSNDCPVPQIPEPHLEAAFARLWNKLRAHRHNILHPMLEQLDSLKNAAANQNKKLYEIDLQIDAFMQQNHMLNLLRSKGYIEAVAFQEKANEIGSKISTLQHERRCLTENADNDHIDATKRLLDALETGPKEMLYFDAACFSSIVDKIIALSQTEVRFRLINGLELTEAVERVKR